MKRLEQVLTMCALSVASGSGVYVMAGDPTPQTCYKQQNQACCTEFWDAPGGPQHRPACTPTGSVACNDQVFENPTITKVIVALNGKSTFALAGSASCKWYVFACVDGVCTQTATQSMAPCLIYVTGGVNCPVPR